jgi:predicted lipoprotein with Yx(FWY)xxD motif
MTLPLIAGCGSSSSSSSSTNSSSGAAAAARAASSPKIATSAVTGVGQVLVDAEGHTLYTFSPDNASKVTCVGSCASVWPPDKVAAGSEPVASGLVNASLLSTKHDPEGGDVITYAGWPLYSYVQDSSAGTAAGQGLMLDGGYWHVITPAGKLVQ